MRNQEIMWTALPNNIFADAQGVRHMRIAVFISPQLNTDEGLPRPTLSQFPDFLDWPSTVGNIQLSVQFAGRPAVQPTRIGYPQDPPPSQLWQGIFRADTYVKPYEFPDLAPRLIHSYPVRNVLSRLKENYQSLAVDSPTQFPRMDREGPGQRLRNFLQEIALPPQRRSQLDTQIGNQLRGAQLRALSNPVYLPPASLGPRGVTTPPQEGRILAPPQMRLMAPGTAVQAQGLAREEITPAALDFRQIQAFHEAHTTLRRPLPRVAELVASMDFHQIISALGQYPGLMRRLGLILDLDLIYDPAWAGAQWVKVIPTWTPQTAGSQVTPRTRCTLSETRFRPATRTGNGELADGLLDLDDEEQYEIGQVDVDGTALKTLDLAEQVAGVAPPAALGTLTPRVLPPAAQPAAPAPGPQPGVITPGALRARVPALVLQPGMLSVLEPSEEVSLPTTRSAGIWVAKINRAVEMASIFTRARVLNSAAVQKREEELELYAEDLVRGYRLDVWDDVSGQWRSTCMRTGTYRFTRTGHQLTLQDEGWISSGATTPEGPDDDLYLHEVLFRWEGWSLVAPRPGKAVEDPGALHRAGGEFGLEATFTPIPGTLPRLRFGRSYRLRARVVDLAGGGLTLPQAGDSAATAPLTYLRYEPLNPPSLVPRRDLSGSPGESLEHLVVRSFNDSPARDTQRTEQNTERHAAPPPTSQLMSETHGMFDGEPAMRGDEATYNLIADNDGALGEVYEGAQLDIPYLPDPLALGALVRLRSLQADQPRAQELRIPFTGQWPDPRAFRIQALEPTGADLNMQFDEAQRVLRVPLRKAEILELKISCYLEEPQLPRMGMWRWTVERAVVPQLQAAPLELPRKREIHRQIQDAPRRVELLQTAGLSAAQIQQVQNLGREAQEGKHWLVTPHRTLILVHAVQQPLTTPNLAALTASRSFGDTVALLNGESPIDGKSTVRVDVQAQWEEPVDPVLEPTWKTLPGQKHVGDLPVMPATRTLRIQQLRHEFGDTRYRRVSYRATATSRFREYLGFTDEQVEAGERVITRGSAQFAVDVLSSARPATPQVLYVVPVFGWQKLQRGDTITSTRQGGGLRVYLERPWFSSGEGELLGVVMRQPATGPRVLTALVAEPRGLDRCVTQWGQDPLWRTGTITADPTPADFRRTAATETGLTLEEVPGARVAVAGYEVHYDADRRLWYADVELDPGRSYFPFVRLALARYQPKSVRTDQADVKLSRVVMADFAQLAPERGATLTWKAGDDRTLQVSVAGSTYLASPAGQGFSYLEATVETRAPNQPPDLGWYPVADGTVPLQSARTPQGTALWQGEVTLPAARGTQPFRIVIKEYEEFPAEGPPLAVLGAATIPQRARRLVYADAVEV